MRIDLSDTLRRVELTVLATDRAWIERQLRTWRIAQGMSGAAERRRFVELCRWRRTLAATVEALSDGGTHARTKQPDHVPAPGHDEDDRRAGADLPGRS